MKKTGRFGVWLSVAMGIGLAFGMLCGCEAIMPRQSALHVAPPPVTPPFMTSKQSSGEALAAPESLSPEIPSAREKSHRAVTERVTSVLSRAQPPQIENEKLSAPSLTMGDESSSKTGAEHELMAANIKLSRIDPERLSSEDAATYRQAADFINAARRAFDERDYVAALGLARKASVLASKVAVVSSKSAQ